MSQFDKRLENFLFAEIGIGDGGAQLTMLSAFARRGSDPWMEAARLAALPQVAASEALSSLLGNMPSARCSMPDRPATTARLLKLLPGTGERMSAIPFSRPHFRMYLERHLVGIAGVLLISVILVYLIK